MTILTPTVTVSQSIYKCLTYIQFDLFCSQNPLGHSTQGNNLSIQIVLNTAGAGTGNLENRLEFPPGKILKPSVKYLTVKEAGSPVNHPDANHSIISSMQMMNEGVPG